MKIWTKDSALAHIRANIKIDTATGCHEWQRSRTKDGYGQLSQPIMGIKGVHRLVVHLAHGHEFASRHEQVMHDCHNRACCNPDHLSVGTAKENMAQAAALGRLKAPVTCGEDHWKTSLTNGDVLSIREMLAKGIVQAKIGEKFGIAQSTVSKIKRGVVWSHVTL